VINDDTFVLAVTADTISMVHLVCLFMKTYLLALLQGLDLVCCTFLRKLSASAICMHEGFNSILSTLTEADKSSHFDQT